MDQLVNLNVYLSVFLRETGFQTFGSVVECAVLFSSFLSSVVSKERGVSRRASSILYLVTIEVQSNSSEIEPCSIGSFGYTSVFFCVRGQSVLIPGTRAPLSEGNAWQRI